jgi:hypothetical protein
MDYKPWNADVLDALAWDLPKHYDLKKTIELIVLSRAYQLPAVPAADESQKEYVFAGPTIRRMSAEQFVDSLATVTGVWPDAPAANISAEAGKHRKARWIWNKKNAPTTAPVGTVQFRRSMKFDESIKKAETIVAVDNTFELQVNGKKVADGVDTWGKPAVLDLTKHVRGGAKNDFLIIATNTPGAEGKPNPAGAWFFLDATYGRDVLDNKGREAGDLFSDAKWEASADGGKTWSAAVDVGGANVAPWSIADKLPSAWVVEPPGEVRAALLYADPLTSALGRPNREQVNTVRPTAATTLQMLELTNGSTLADMLTRGAKKLAGTDGRDAKSSADIVKNIYARAFGRAPTPSELSAATGVLGAQVSAQGVEDLLWAVMMLPEYQLIR